MHGKGGIQAVNDTLAIALLGFAGLTSLGTVLLCAFLHSRLKRLNPRWADENCVPVRRLCRRDMLLLATHGRLHLAVGFTLCLMLYLWAMWAFGIMSSVQTLASCGTLAVIVALPAWLLCRNCLLPLKPLMSAGNCDQILKGIGFRYVRGGWQYSDGSWFIRVGGGEGCALRAPELDFSVPPRPSGLGSFAAGARFPHPIDIGALLVQRRDGRRQIARVDATDDIVEWLEAHKTSRSPER